MAYDPHHDSIIDSIKEIFARCRELEDRLEFLVGELEAHADYSDFGDCDRREIANILEGYYSEFDAAEVRAAKVAKSYRHPKQYCVAYQQGGMGCPDCYCDSSCTDNGCHICGGNTPERIDDQIAWLEKKIAEDKKNKK